MKKKKKIYPYFFLSLPPWTWSIINCIICNLVITWHQYKHITFIIIYYFTTPFSWVISSKNQFVQKLKAHTFARTKRAPVFHRAERSQNQPVKLFALCSYFTRINTSPQPPRTGTPVNRITKAPPLLCGQVSRHGPTRRLLTRVPGGSRIHYIN